MADLDDRHLIDAGLTLLRADTGLVVVPDAEGVVPAVPVSPYVRVYAMVSRPDAADGQALDGRSRTTITRWYCHSVGATEPAAIAVAMRVRAALLDQRPIVPDWSTGMIRQEVARPPARSEDAGTPVYDAVAVYKLAATS